MMQVARQHNYEFGFACSPGESMHCYHRDRARPCLLSLDINVDASAAQVQAVIAACRQQQEHLAYIAAHLPPFLPAAADALSLSPSLQQQDQREQQQRYQSAAEPTAPPAMADERSGKAAGGASFRQSAAGRGATGALTKENARPGRPVANGAGAAASAASVAEPTDRRQRPPAPRRCCRS